MSGTVDVSIMLAVSGQEIPKLRAISKAYSGWPGQDIHVKRLPGTNLSSENNLPMFRLNAPVVIREALSRNVGKLFSELKLVPDSLLFIYAEVN